ncbi:hypothetical protein ACRPM7_02490 [Burkholderia vietnamiensis]|nr:hypothetical protein [Burkholderia vietnamiensis]MBR8151795.1 hypothetical protein [Burkholderia vietnamiensis]QTK88786.1 hypothetical protein J4D21_26645 [Burkholderia vietnamiensis]HDR9318916.1 hypothetical protein [Burkholderia vietnamiensis]
MNIAKVEYGEHMLPLTISFNDDGALGCNATVVMAETERQLAEAEA